MALRIRLTRRGAKKRPHYRIVVTDSANPRDGRFIQQLGFYNPMVPKDHPERLRFYQDRVQQWLDKGAVPSDRVAKFLAEEGYMKPRGRAEQTKKNQPKAKAQRRMREREEARRAAEEAQEGATE